MIACYLLLACTETLLKEFPEAKLPPQCVTDTETRHKQADRDRQEESAGTGIARWCRQGIEGCQAQPYVLAGTRTLGQDLARRQADRS